MTLLDSPSVPDVDAAERSTRLQEASAAWNDRIAADVTNAHLTYRVRGAGEGAVATRLRAGKHQLLVDEPGALAGDDLAASPVEFALAALVSCQVVVYRLYAEALGIAVDDIDITAEGDLDARRLFAHRRERARRLLLGPARHRDHRPRERRALRGAEGCGRRPLPGARPLREPDAGVGGRPQGLTRVGAFSGGCGWRRRRAAARSPLA